MIATDCGYGIMKVCLRKDTYNIIQVEHILKKDKQLGTRKNGLKKYVKIVEKNLK